MPRWWTTSAVTVLSLLSTAQATRAASNDAEIRIDPRAKAQLRKMSDYLTRLGSFQVHARSSQDLVSTEGQKVQVLAEQDVALKRPNLLRVERRDSAADVTMRYDGKNLSMIGKRNRYFAIVPLPSRLPEAVDLMRERYGVDAPAADLIVPNPYEGLVADAVTGRYIGLESINGRPAHHLAFSGKEVDWQIWIADGTQPLPLRYAITAKREDASPEFTVELTEWKPNAPLDRQAFFFNPPRSATRIDLLPVKQEHLNEPVSGSGHDSGIE